MKNNEGVRMARELAHQFVLLDMEIGRLREENKGLKVRLENTQKNIGNDNKHAIK